MSYTHINLRKLHHIQTIAKTGSFVRAATVLAITQSALTRSIQSVEAHFGVRIFDRDRGGVHLTAVGRSLLERAAPLLREAQDIEDELLRIGGGEEGAVAIGMSPIVAKAALKPLLADQLHQRPAARTQAYVRGSERLLALLREEEIEFCTTTLGSIATLADDLAALPVTKISNMLAVAAGHPLLAQADLSFDDIIGFPLISSTYPAALVRYFEQTGRRFHPAVVTEDYATLLELTLSGDAIWLTSSIGCSDHIAKGLIRRLPIDTASILTPVDIVIVSLSRRTMSPLARLLINKIREIIEDATGQDNRE